jgi:hypothetical protein
MPAKQQSDKEVDFSNYFKNQQKSNQPSKRAGSGQDSQSRRVTVLVLILVGLMLLEIWMMWSGIQSRQQGPPPPPAGYEWVYPQNAPAHISPIQK